MFITIIIIIIEPSNSNDSWFAMPGYLCPG